MSAWLLRRFAYALVNLFAVNLLTFALFFVVNTPDDMARMQLGNKRVSAEAIERWKQEKGYDRPQWFNASASGPGRWTDTLFFEKSVRLFLFDFGNDIDGRSIREEILARMGPSLARCSSSDLPSTSPSRLAWRFFVARRSICRGVSPASASCRYRVFSTSSAASTW